MCKELISISWDGELHDCDFNQMLSIPINWKSLNIMNLDDLKDVEKKIAVANHCFGCTAGSGSSCGGALID